MSDGLLLMPHGECYMDQQWQRRPARRALCVRLPGRREHGQRAGTGHCRKDRGHGALGYNLLDPEMYGYAVTAEVRDAARWRWA